MPGMHTPPLASLCALAIACSLSGCAALQGLLGPAAIAAGTAVGAYETAVSNQAKAAGLSPTDPRVLAAVEAARKADAAAAKLAEQRAAESKARDLEEARRTAALADQVTALAAAMKCPAPPPCPSCSAPSATSTAPADAGAPSLDGGP